MWYIDCMSLDWIPKFAISTASFQSKSLSSFSLDILEWKSRPVNAYARILNAVFGEVLAFVNTDDV